MTLYLPLIAGVAIGLLAGLVIIVLCRAPRPERPDTASLRLGELLAANREFPKDVPMRVHCGWCNIYLRGPHSATLLSHGICPACARKFQASASAIHNNP